MILGRWAATGCCLGLSVWALNCSGAGLKRGPALLSRPGNALPGAENLLPRGLGMHAAGIMAHAAGSKAGALPGNKGSTTVAAGINAFASPATIPTGTGVASDGSLGSGVVSYTNSTYTIPAAVGTQVGGNLFESFSQFNLLQGETADFQGPSSVQNILARVTGGSVSSIDGAIESDIQGANLFLINPAGIVFGANASLNVSGAFTASTADYVTLTDGGQFNAQPGNDNLTSAAVSTFGFLAAAPNSITVNGSTLAVPDGQTLALLAGSFQMTGGSLLAPDGSIRIAATGGDTYVESSQPTFIAPAVPGVSLLTEWLGFPQTSPLRGPVNISNATINADGSGSGIDLICDTLTLTDTTLSAKSNTPIPQGASEQLPPYISIRAIGAVVLDNSQVIVDAIGNSETGVINLSSYSSVTLEDGSVLSASAPSAQLAGAGTIELQAPIITLTGPGTAIDLDGGVDASSGPSGLLEIGAVGFPLDLISTPTKTLYSPPPTELLEIRDGAKISCVASSGLPIASEIVSRNVTVTGAGSEIDFNSIADLSGPYEAPIFGAALLDITAHGSLTVSAGGKILAETMNLGIASEAANAGAGGSGINIIAGNVVATGGGSEISVSTDDQVDAGTLGIAATGDVTISDGARLAASTTSYGNGGNIVISARSIDIQGNGDDFTGIDSSAKGSDVANNGNGGSITLKATQSLTVADGASVIATTQGAGAGGKITVVSPVVTLEGDSTINTSSLGPNPPVTYETGPDPTASDLSLRLNIDDPSDSDLSAWLIDPAGNVVELFGSGYAFGQNFKNTKFSDSTTQYLFDGVAPYSGTYQPATSFLQDFLDNLSGDWTLEVENAGSSVGKLVNWTLIDGKQHFTSTGGDETISAMGTLNAILDVNASPARTATRVPGGNAGGISIHGNVLNIMNGSSLVSNTQNSGKGGSISVKVAQLNLSNASSITAGASGLGSGGDIAITSDDVNLAAASSIGSANTGSGDAGSVSIMATGDVTLAGASSVSVDAAQANAGKVTITAGNEIILSGGSSVIASAGGTGGNILLTAPSFINLFDSAIIATAGSSHTGGSQAGKGGDIKLDPEYILLDDSLISANASIGQGGNIKLESAYYINGDSSITATGATSGTITITSPELDLSGALTGLPSMPIGSGTRLQETCAIALQGDFSSFLAVGQGDIEASPDQALGGGTDPGEDLPRQAGHRKPDR